MGKTDVARQMVNIVVLMSEIKNAKPELILSNQQHMLRSAFHQLVELHKTGDSHHQDKAMLKYLKRSKKIMAELPEDFLDQHFSTLSTFPEQWENPAMIEDAESKKITLDVRNELQDAFDYVDGLEAPPSR